jgi:ABC-type transport system involved in multi-copper enzyme maturation permease subunit
VLENLPTNTLPRLLRRTTLSAIAVGAVGFLLAIFIAPPTAALGVAVGITLAIFNFRQLVRQTGLVEVKGEQNTKVVRRQLGGRTAARLAVLTAIVLVMLWLNAPLGIGIVSGLVIYQIVFVFSVLRVVANQGGVQ